jgi:hypothetical protein
MLYYCLASSPLKVILIRRQERKNSTDLPHPDRGTSSIAKPKSAATTQISSKPTPKPKPLVPVPVEPAPMADTAKPRQEFHGITYRPQTARRTTGLQSNASAATSHYPRNHKGKRYRNLSHQNVSSALDVRFVRVHLHTPYPKVLSCIAHFRPGARSLHFYALLMTYQLTE